MVVWLGSRNVVAGSNENYNCANERMFTVHEAILLVMKKPPDLVATIFVYVAGTFQAVHIIKHA
jgi:hypothetical protein